MRGPSSHLAWNDPSVIYDPSDFFLVEGLRIGIQIPNIQVPRPNRFFLGPLEK